jgi:hypothetical protein
MLNARPVRTDTPGLRGTGRCRGCGGLRGRQRRWEEATSNEPRRRTYGAALQRAMRAAAGDDEEQSRAAPQAPKGPLRPLSASQYPNRSARCRPAAPSSVMIGSRRTSKSITPDGQARRLLCWLGLQVPGRLATDFAIVSAATRTQPRTRSPEDRIRSVMALIEDPDCARGGRAGTLPSTVIAAGADRRRGGRSCRLSVW